MQFRVTDPATALQPAARRSRAIMTLEQMLTHRIRLSEDTLADVLGSAAAAGVEILRADVNDRSS